MNISTSIRQVYSHWNIPIETKLFPFEQRKNFLEKLQKQILLKRFHKSLKGFDKPTDKRTFEQNKKIDFKIWIVTTFIQCNTIVQLTNYSVPRNNNTNTRDDNFLEIIIIKMHVFLHSGLIIYVIVYDIYNLRNQFS